jgi:hypothetical protein
MSKLSITVHGDSAAELKTNLALAVAALVATAGASTTGAAAGAAGTDAAAKAKAAADAKTKADAAAKAKAAADAAAKAKLGATAGGPDLNSLREQGRACIKAGKNAEMKAALTELGADSITTMDPAKYGELAAKLTAILNPEAAPAAEGEDAL